MHRKEITDAIENDKRTDNHSQHQLPSVLASFGALPDEAVIRIFGKAHESKLDALYVDVRGDEITRPDEMIDQSKCEHMLKLLNVACYGFDVFLKDTDEEFVNGINFLNPSIFSETIKSRPNKYVLRGRRFEL